MTIFKGLFSPAYGYVRTIVCIALGIVLVAWPGIAAKTLVMAAGVALIIVGGISLAVSLRGSARFGSLMSFNGLFDVLFGLLLIVFSGFFISLIMYVFGALFIIFGIVQISSFLSARTYVKIPAVYYIMPLLVAVCGFTLLFKPFEAQETIFIVTGYCLIVYGVSELFATIKMKRALSAISDAETKTVEDVNYEEVSSVPVEESETQK